MENREELIKKTVLRLQEIQTLDEFKAAREEIIDLVVEIFKSAIYSLKAFFENMFSMTPEEQQEKSKQFQDESYLLSPEVMKELDRLDKLPGAADYVETFADEMDKRLDPYLEQFTEQMGKLMETFMGGMMEGVAEAMGTEEEEIEDTYEFDYDNPDTPVMLYDLYYARTLETLKENKKFVIEAIEEQLQSDIWDLEVLTDMPPEDLLDSDMVKIAEIRKRMERVEPEMDKEIARISTLPNASEEAAKIQKEIMDRVANKITELNGYLAKINKVETSEP